MVTCESYGVYVEMNNCKRRGVPFFMAERHLQGARVTRNQHGTQYKFSDGSRLSVSRRLIDESSPLHDTNQIKCFLENSLCIAVMAMRVAIEPGN